MKILCIHPALSGRAYREFSVLKEKGFEIVLAYHSIGASLTKETRTFWTEKENIITNKIINYLNPSFLLPGAFRSSIKKIIKKYNIDIIHSYSCPDAVALAAICYSKIPVIYDMRDLLTGLDESTLLDSLASFNIQKRLFNFPLIKNNLKRYLYKYCYKLEKECNEKSSGNVYSSVQMFKLIKSRYDIDIKRSIILPNYLVERQIPKIQKQKISIKDGETHIVYAGNVTLDGYKNFIDIFNRIISNKIHLHLYPTCNYDILSKYKNKLLKNNYIHFHDAMPPKKLLIELTQYDYGLIPYNTRYDKLHLDVSLSNKLFDYISCRIPVISSDMIATREFILKYKLGFYYENAGNLIEKIYKLKSTDFIINSYKFTMEKHISSLIKLYEKLN